MDKRPVDPKRRRAYEAAIRAADLVAYAVVFIGGVALVALPYGSATQALAGFELLIFLWAAFLLGGGLVGFVGRLTRYWLVETPATVAASVGTAIYGVVLAGYTFTSVAAFFTETFVVLAFILLTRRWLELQIFSTEPHADWRGKLFEALNRRTQNVVPRSNP